MSDLNSTISTTLAMRYTKLAGTLHDLAAPLTEDQFWVKPFSFGNSFGHLVLHLTGNLNYYIGEQIAQTGYVRDRPLEFSDASRPSKKKTLAKFDEAVAMVVETIGKQSAGEWAKAYTAAGADATDRFGMVLSCATHLHSHIGQMIYLAFQFKAEN